MKKLIETIKNIFKIEELRKRILFTLSLLLVYRFGSFVVIPGINPACAYYDDLIAVLAPVLDQEPTGQTVAFFYITTSGAVNVRKSGDYIAKAIRMAGGEYVSFDESGEENALSTMTIQMESFYDTALDADVLIYNSTIDGGITSIDELLAKSPLFADFKAVQNGNVWCITKNFYQESLALGDMILDVHAVLNNPDAADLRFLKKLS